MQQTIYAPMLARWHAMEPVARGAVLVSAGSMTLVIMAALVKFLGTRLPSIEILFFRSLIGFLLVMPMFLRNPLEPLRTKRLGMHLLRGATGAVGNACFFWTITHMLLADAMALQFSRPLFMIPLALIFLGEIAGWRRSIVDAGRLRRHPALRAAVHRRFRSRMPSSARPARCSARLVVICIKRLADHRADARDHVLLRVLECAVRADPGDLVLGDAELAGAGAAGRGRRSRHLRSGA